MIKNILVPIDYSEGSLNALDTAVHIAAGNKASLKILHVNDLMPGEEDQRIENKTIDIYNTIAPKVLAQYNVNSEIIFAEGIVGHAIVNAVLENNIDLIVMGTHGTSGSRELFIGLNAYYTVKRASCPVLLIPEGKKWCEFNNVLFPVRAELFSRELFKFPYNLLRKNKQPTILKLLGVMTETKEEAAYGLISMVYEIKVKEATRKIDLQVGFNANPDIAEGALSCAAQTNADLLVMSPGLDILSKPFFIGPFSQRIINHAKIPILSLLRIK